jgi:ATP-dependent RNA helicase DBP3
MLFHLRQHLKTHPSSAAAPTRILAFALYKKEAQRLEQTIRRAGYSVAGLHGDLSQDARFKALEQFKTGKVNVMVATDVAARGLDIPDVGLVLNVTFPLTTGQSTISPSPDRRFADEQRTLSTDAAEPDERARAEKP